MEEEELLKVLDILLNTGQPATAKLSEEQLESIALKWSGMTLDEMCKVVNANVIPTFKMN